MGSEIDSPDLIVDRIRTTLDVKERAQMAGLRPEPFNDVELQQACANGIYPLPHHAHCDLPKLNFPVDPDWRCALWHC